VRAGVPEPHPYWDRPHRLPDDAPDPFTIFACNERKLMYLRVRGIPEHRLRQMREQMDEALAQYRATLTDALLTLPPRERPLWRLYVPQLAHWPSWASYGPIGPRQPS
jgi:hypothetical protein